MRTHRYRLIKSSWGVAVDITAYLEDAQHSRDGAPFVRITDDSLSTLHQRSAEVGLLTVLQTYRETYERLQGKALVIVDITYTPTDFQEEGISCAVAGWLCDELGLKSNPLKLEFTDSLNRYVLKEKRKEGPDALETT